MVFTIGEPGVTSPNPSVSPHWEEDEYSREWLLEVLTLKTTSHVGPSGKNWGFYLYPKIYFSICCFIMFPNLDIFPSFPLIYPISFTDPMNWFVEHVLHMCQLYQMSCCYCKQCAYMTMGIDENDKTANLYVDSFVHAQYRYIWFGY